MHKHTVYWKKISLDTSLLLKKYFVAESDMMILAFIPKYSEDDTGEPVVTSKQGLLSELKANPDNGGRSCLKNKM